MTSAYYQAYMQSPELRVIRALKLESVGNRCEHRTLLFWRCGECHHLQAHHRHYRTLGHEGLKDLQVLCKAHHDQADKLRKFKNRVKDKLWTLLQ